MNTSDSERLSGALESLGLQPVGAASAADVIVLNSCVVRQHAEDRVSGTLGMMKPIKELYPKRTLALMGCMVGSNIKELATRFPYVDIFMKPQDYRPLLKLLGEKMDLDWEGCLENLTPPNPSISTHVPIIHGCDLMCTFCIIPYRRGRQTSVPLATVVSEVQSLVERGVKEVTLLGQTVDAYGHDLPAQLDLADLLQSINNIRGLERIRFLTSHPMFMTDRIISAMSQLEKVCEQINLPIQSADDQVLVDMRRRYTESDYRQLIDKIRSKIPGVSISTDIIIGFPGETSSQYEKTIKLVTDMRFEKIHLASYSPRPGTIAFRKFPDNVTKEEKDYRFKNLEQIQRQIQYENNAKLVGQKLEVLIDGHKRGKWHGRTRSDKLVYIENTENLLGQLSDVKITSSGPWSLNGMISQSNGLKQSR